MNTPDDDSCERPERSPTEWTALLLCLVLVSMACARPAVRFRAVYLDLDGTALDSTHKVRPATRAALDEYKACGGQVGVATGRTREQAKDALEEVKPTLPVVLFNGALTIAPRSGAVVSAEPLSREMVASVLEALDSADVTGIVVHYEGKDIASTESAELRRFAEEASIALEESTREAVMREAMSPLKLLVVAEQGAVDQVFGMVNAQFGEALTVVISGDRTIEVLSKGVNKGAAVFRALKAHKIAQADTVAFGDSENDAQLLGGVAAGIAMSNCRGRTCETAVARVGSNETDAIAEFIRRVVLTPECGQRR